MEIEYLKRMDRIIKKAGTKDPDDVLAFMGYEYVDCGDSIPGFIAKCKTGVFYSVNKNLSKTKYAFASFHEAFHGICGHLNTPGFLTNGFHTDDFINRRLIASTEKEANIGASDVLIDTVQFLEMTGYDSADVQAYIKSVESFEKAASDYQNHLDIVQSIGASDYRIQRMQAYQRDLYAMYKELQEQAADISNTGVCLTRSELAAEFNVPEFIIDYKFEAMSVRKYKVPSVELPTYDKVFGSW